ncbi:hypothetical protein Q9L58_010235 [Maublancomyces gigas]|uniref:Uncharacterized protein n=1 Tax=Discina gigas TaxID=1032678 RepID=A0ABR3G597_9PEZI
MFPDSLPNFVGEQYLNEDPRHPIHNSAINIQHLEAEDKYNYPYQVSKYPVHFPDTVATPRLVPRPLELLNKSEMREGEETDREMDWVALLLKTILQRKIALKNMSPTPLSPTKYHNDPALMEKVAKLTTKLNTVTSNSSNQILKSRLKLEESIRTILPSANNLQKGGPLIQLVNHNNPTTIPATGEGYQPNTAKTKTDNNNRETSFWK